MNLRFIFCALVVLRFGMGALQAQIEWNGQVANPGLNDITVNGNWAGGTAPSGAGSDDVSFGLLVSGPAFAAGDTTQFILIPTSLALRNISFVDTGRPEYSIQGSGSPTLTLNGNVSVSSESPLVFLDSTLSLSLSSGTHTVTVGGNSVLTVASAVTGSGGILKDGGGALHLNNANNFTGGIELTAGDLVLQTSTSAGTGTLTLHGGTQLSPSANITLTNAINLADVGGLVENEDYGDYNLTLTGLISGGGGFDWCTNGALSIIGSNSFSGGVDMREGKLLLGGTNPIGSGTLWLYDGVQVAPAGADFAIANDVSLYGAIKLGECGDSHSLTFSGVLSDSGSIDYYGAGKLTLSGVNTYTGNTTIHSGTVVATNNSALGTGSVYLNSGALVAPGGVTLTNPITVSGGNLAGGGTFTNGSNSIFIGSNAAIVPEGTNSSTIATLSFHELELGNGGTYVWNMLNPGSSAGTGWDLISVSSALLISSSSTPFKIVLESLSSSGTLGPASGFSGPQSFTILTAGSISGFSTANFTFDYSAWNTNLGPGSFTISQSGNSLLLNFTPVPEPSTWMMLGAGLGVTALGCWRRRRR